MKGERSDNAILELQETKLHLTLEIEKEEIF